MMAIVLAEVVFPTWQGVLLILLCFGSLVIALYCLLFMVPLKSFVQRINSLGGGMQGMRAHVDGVRSETDERIAAVEGLVHENVNALRAEMEGAVGSATEAARQVRMAVQRLDRAVQHLQGEAANYCSASREAAVDLDGLRRQLGELQHDFEVLQGELSGSIRRMVSESYGTLEGTFVGALEAVSSQMLRGSSPLKNGRESKLSAAHGPNGSSGDRGRQGMLSGPSSKIISAEPLFAEAERPGRAELDDEGKDIETRQAERQESPAT